ncbi:acyltransferase family protein [Desertimonas flava]|uniref:acyltransferase family protein n=1 Tax=Desertimonas flava TaxID=2064846 RepID=UPI0013C44A3D|nr:acyltransferase [Desertimonas flava]
METPGGSPFERLTTEHGVTHQPGLDGLRGLAVAAVVLFHFGVGGVTGGYLGVSLFFTISGVLIGTLVLHELTTTGRFSLRSFWLRRARRLLPAALVTLAAVAVARLVSSHLAETSGADVVASALDVANWHFLAADASYADLFGGPSAVLHFWSLAIEEQFYLAGGLLALAVAIARPRRPLLVVGASAGAVAVVSFALPMTLGLGVDRVYYGTDTRAGELMIGVVIAAAVAAPRRRHWLLERGRPLAVIGVAAAAGTIALWLNVTPGSDALRRGLLPAVTLCSAGLVVAALLPRGPVAVVARRPGLTWLGRISYSLYLVHWPVIVVADRLSDDRSVLRAAGLVGLSVVLAQLLTMLVERPVRLRRVPTARLVAAAALVVTTIGVASAMDGRRTASAELLAGLDDAAESAPHPDGRPGLPRVAMFGDSVAFSMLLSLGHATTPAAYERAPSETDIGCGIALSPYVPPEDPHRCDLPAERFFGKARGEHLDAAVLISCQWELVAQPIPGAGDETRVIGDPVVDAYIYAAYDHVADRLAAAGVGRVLWMRCPYMSQTVGWDGLSDEFRASRHPQRVDRLNAIVQSLADARDDVDVLAFDAWMNDHVDDASLRPDGSHYDYERTNAASERFVQLVNEAVASL